MRGEKRGMSIRLPRSNSPGGLSLFSAHHGGVALACFVLSLLVLGASTTGSIVQTIATLICLYSLSYAIWAGIVSLSAVKARRSGRPGSARIDEIEHVFALHHPRYWPDNIRDRSKVRLVFVDNFGRKQKSMPHPRAFFGTLKEGSQIDVYVGKKRSWWNGDIGHRKTKFVTSTQPLSQTE